MPLTVAHPAAIVWGYRWRHGGLPFAALVIGSMSPDFEYLLRLRPMGHFAHSPLGIFLFCLPAGWLVYLVYLRVIAPVLPQTLPAVMASRWFTGAPRPLGRVRNILVASGAIVVGAATHSIWDQCTHQSGVVVTHVPLLQWTVLELPVFKYLQHGSTLFGLAFLALWIRRLPVVNTTERTAVPKLCSLRFGLLYLVVLTVLASIFPPVGLGGMVVESMDALLIATTGWCLWLRFHPVQQRMP